MTKTKNVYENPDLRQRAELIARRAKIANQLLAIVSDADYWNRTHPDQKPIEIDIDLTKEVIEMCLNSPSSAA